MKNEFYKDDIKTLRDRNARKNVMIAGLMAALLLSLLTLVQTIGTSRTVITPPSIERSFWVTNNRASSDYLEQMAAFSAWLILDVTPVSAEWKKQTLLQFTTPDATGELKTRIELEAERLKKLNGATYFAPRQFSSSEDTQAVLISGQLRTQVNGENTSSVDKQYLAKFVFKGGRMHLADFKEVVNEAKK